ncbi:Major Facilitator Superfamily protein [Klenkia marina]|uniref:Major Facilitator Superfamily protein n=1 Tax=Klenkia marina TaxID=1960309 RepID=A0A1G4YRH1_9ACTN|nr:MFS transporter [Klenkia marina]SCX55498.1 Major Facilitator Superfamily protein [Klenkia marina]
MTAPGTATPATSTGARALVVAFCALVAATQVLWLTFSPVSAESAAALGVGSGAVANLAAVNPLLFVLLALPAGRWLDRSLVPALTTGAALTVGGAVVRALAADSYAVVLTGQVVLSLGQPLVLGATTVVAVRYVSPAGRTAAIAAASAGQFVGILVAALVAQPAVDAVGVGGLVRAEAVAVAAVGLVFVVLARRVGPRSEAGAAPDAPAGRLRPDRLLVGLAVMLFVGVGVFNAVATWLDAVLDDLGAPGRAGVLIAAMTVAGIVGAAVLPALAAARDRRRTVLLVAALTSAVGLAVAAAVPRTAGATVLVVVLPLVGFVLLAGLPVALEWAELHVGAARAARATSLLLLAGNAGGVVLVLAAEVTGGRAAPTLLLLALLSLPALAAAWSLPRRVQSS